MSTPSLTKKQQKAQAFRAKQKAKKSGKGEEGREDVPEVDLIEDEGPEERATVAESSKKGDAATREAGGARDSKAGAAGKGKGKGKKTAWDDDEEGGTAKKSKKEVKQRFILFVGNLGFKTTRETVQHHFKPVLTSTSPPSVRLLTTKATPTTPAKSRGIAFLEVPTSVDLQACLKLHHSTVDGRRINVELTAGGGGKSEARKGKIVERNERVGVQRERKAEKEKEAELGRAEGEGEEVGAGEGTRERDGEKGGDRGKGGESGAGPAGGKRKRDEKHDADGVVDTPDGKVKIRGGRRVKVKSVQKTNMGDAALRHPQTGNDGLSGWAQRSPGIPLAGGGGRGGGGGEGGGGRGSSRGGAARGRGGAGVGRRTFEPTGANALVVK